MDSKYKSFLEKKWVADKIEKRFHNSEPGFFIDYEISDFEKDKNTPSRYEQVVILTKMEKRDAIKIYSRKFEISLSETTDLPKENLFRIEILQPGFESYLKWLKEVGESFDTRTKEGVLAEIQIKGLSSNSDGSITYEGRKLKMRNQIKDLCRLFMANAGSQITIDDIKEQLIKIAKRPATPNSTIAKYVSELHIILQKNFGKSVISNQTKEGWTFNP